MIKGNIIINCQFMAENSLILGNKSHIYGSFLNIILNDKQHGLPDGGTITIRTDHKHEHEELNPNRSYIHVTIEDDGVGIDQKILSKIFEPFFTTKCEHGTGLGLASTLQRVQEHEGLIFVDSELGKGTKFEIYLPLYIK